METVDMEDVPQPPTSSAQPDSHQDSYQDSHPDSRQESHPHSQSHSHPVSLQGDHPDTHSDSHHAQRYDHSHQTSHPHAHPDSHQASSSHSHPDSHQVSSSHSPQASYSYSYQDDHPDSHPDSHRHSHQASYSHSHQDDLPDSHRHSHQHSHQASYSHSHQGDHPDSHRHSHQHSPPDSDESELPAGADPPYSPFEFEDYYNYQSLGSGYHSLDHYYSTMGSNPILTDSEEDLHNKVDGYRERPYWYDLQSDRAYPRFLASQSSEEEEGKEEKQKSVDPGTFRYNKRVFITALPCLLLTLIMTGETLLLLVTTGGLVIVLMAHSGEEVGKRCVVVFVLLFIPCHIIAVGTVLPLLWLSVWNLLLVAIVNMFCVLTGGWIIIQFVAFRMEEPSLCATIERGLFSIYPFLCSALVAWILSTVVSLPLTPFLFLFIWFVCLQLYLVPAPSSFTLTKKEVEEKEGGKEEEEGVLREATMLTLVLVFIVSGPLIHATLTVVTPSLSLFSLPSLTLLAMLVCVGLFLSTLLHTRQLCDYMGWRHIKVVQARWGSGVGVVLLSYPVLQQLGMTSHFLLSLPVAVAGFVSLGLTLSLKKGKVLPLVLMVVLLVLLCLWISHLPWTLTYYFLGMVSLTNFYTLVAVNFILCVLAIYVSWHASRPLLGWLLLLQAFGQTVCELGLYQAGLYPLPTYQLTGILAAYTLHRLHLAGKLSPTLAAAATAVHLTKTTTGMLGYLLRGEGRGGVVEVGVSDFCCMLMLVGVVLWLFVYSCPQHVSLWQAGKHMTLLMLSLGLSAQSFLLPLGDFLLQEDLTLADLVGLWYGVGGGLMMLYALQHGGGGGEKEKEGAVDQLMKVAMVMGGVGALVMVMQPQFVLTTYAVYQWCEVVSVLLTAALLVTRVDMSLTKILITAACLAPCPGVHTTISLYGDIATVLHYVLLSMLCWLLLSLIFMVVKMGKVSDAVDRAIKAGAVLTLSMLVSVLGVDVVNFEYRDTVWDYPAWSLMLAVSATLSAALKSLALKLGPHHLPLVKKEDHSVPLIPVISNVFTVLTFLLAATQGPFDSLLHALWCFAWSLFLVFLQRDALFLSSLSPSNRATPMVLTTIATLVLSTLIQSHLWGFEDTSSVVWGVLEVLVILLSLPVYVVLAGVLWRGEIWSEKAVVFAMPLNALLLVVGSSYTAWLLCVSGFVCGLGMMIFKLPLLPYNFEPVQR